jgi:hypothetical protein
MAFEFFLRTAEDAEKIFISGKSLTLRSPRLSGEDSAILGYDSLPKIAAAVQPKFLP